MRWISFQAGDANSFGFLTQDDLIHDVGSIAKHETLGAALRGGALPGLVAIASENEPTHTLSDVTLLPPITDPDKILCVGLNYRAHQQETGRGGEDHPTIFVRFAAAQVGHRGYMVRPIESNTLDFEGEIAMVIGKRGRRIQKDDYMEHIFGFSCYNDGSVREFQRHTSQFTPGKNFMNTGGFGPWITTVDEIDDLDEMELKTHVNGKLMQYAKSSDLVFGFADLISYCSTFVDLVPGDVIVTGTPGGVGSARNPPVYLDEGDRVAVSINPIGTLEHEVIVR
ncbi:MAG: fumarylacetoacetate hydrolase family protein [Gammaproteobacteria bacterium]|nr:fumarylacetoacetate hydrolase family protein [Gammaproteobacteria bacterium]